MKNVSFDLFLARGDNQKFKAKYRSRYFETMICSSPPVIQCGFFASQPRYAKALIAVQKPLEIHCGTQKLFDATAKMYPELSEIIKINGWFEDSMFLIMEKTTVKINSVKAP